MGKRRLLTLMVILGFLLSPFSGSQPILEASAESSGPPTLSSVGLQTSEELNDDSAQQFIDPQFDPGIESSINAFGTLLYRNGRIVTRTEVGFNSANVSEVQNNLGLNSAGFQSGYPNHHVADDFTIAAGEGWQVDTVTFFAYHYDTYAYPPISTLTGVYLRIWNGQPDVPGSQVIFGDMDSNRMMSTSWTGIYRVPDTALTDQKRPVMQIEAYVGKFLPSGTYWLEWTIIGKWDEQQEPMTVPISILGQTATGNALQTLDGGQHWQQAVDSGTINPQPQQGMPFLIHGVPGDRSEGYWKSIAPINGLGRIGTAAASVNRKIYLIGGQMLAYPQKAASVESYDPNTNTWTTLLGPMPTPATDICVASIGTDIYVAGGANESGQIINTLQVYHSDENTWETISTDPIPQALLGAGCAALNGKLYVFGGQTSSGDIFQKTAFVYSPEAEPDTRWAQLNDMAQSRAYLAAAVVNGQIYAIGGQNFSGFDLPKVEAFNPADETWHSVTNMNAARAGAGAYGVGNSLYVCGGGWYTYNRLCEVYDTTQGYTGTWQEGPAHMLEGRRSFAYANIGPVLYAIAGYNGNFLTTAERWSFDVYLPSIMR